MLGLSGTTGSHHLTPANAWDSIEETGKSAISYLSMFLSTMKLFSCFPGTTVNILVVNIKSGRMPIYLYFFLINVLQLRVEG